MVSPIEAGIDVKMSEDYAYESKTISGSKAADTRPTEAIEEAAVTGATTTPVTTAPPAPAAMEEIAPAAKQEQPLQPAASPRKKRLQEKEEQLPQVTSVVPAIFVPLDADADLTQPFDAPRSRTERAQAMLDTLDYYQSGVRQGFVYLAGLDRRRILGAAKAREQGLEEARKAAKKAADAAAKRAAEYEATRKALQAAKKRPPPAPPAQSAQRPPQRQPPPYDDETLKPDEIDAMIAAMRAPPVPGADYNIIPTLDQQPLPICFPPAADEVPGGRRETVRQLSEVVEQALMQITGYDGHIHQLRDRWKETLEREQKRLDEQFGVLQESATLSAATTTAAQADESSSIRGEGGDTASAGPANAETSDVAMSGT
ncbi:MAG: hypothetical protein STHCBS139747_000329 [Sporothrix thermara]